MKMHTHDVSDFQREQRVQEAIGIVQKTAHVSILYVDVAAIRTAIDRGCSPSVAARQVLALPTRES